MEGHPQLNSKCEASLKCMIPILKRKQTNKQKTQEHAQELGTIIGGQHGNQDQQATLTA